MAERRGSRHHRARKHPQASSRGPESRRLGLHFPLFPLAAVPTEVFSSDMTVDLNRSKLALNYYGPAHTDSDISVTFAEADILHCGDTYWNGIYPFIDYSTGGSVDGMIKAAEANIAAA